MTTRSSKSSAGDGTTPLLRQYAQIKAQHPDHVIFFRCGDFYEMFHDDAKLGAAVLGITLTARGRNSQGESIPLAGIPYHALEPYLARMIRAGHRVAICEQMENPKQAKGVVRREVVRVVTPGTLLEENLLDGKANNYLAAVVREKDALGLASLDFSTGHFSITEFIGARAEERCGHELTRLSPSEVVTARDQHDALLPLVENALGAASGAGAGGGRMAVVEASAVTSHAARTALLRQFGVRDLHGFGAEESPTAVRAAGAILEYLRETQRTAMLHVNELRVTHPGEFMMLDAVTQRSLELVSNLSDATRRHTLLEVLDHTGTAMGGRALRSWILQPLRTRAEINARLDAVQAFVDDHERRRRGVECLRGVNDLERIVSRAACKTANARDLVALRASLRQVPRLRALTEPGAKKPDDGLFPNLTDDPATVADPATCSETPGAEPKISKPAPRPLLDRLRDEMDPLEELTTRLELSLIDTPPLTVREGGMIREGCNARLDELRAISTDSKSWIAQMRADEIAATGISNLKIGYNRVFGYYIEVTKAQVDRVPPHYIRKQTLANGERYVTPELKEKEEIILHAEERIQELEFEMFEALRDEVCARTREIQRTARAVAALDVIVSLAQAAVAGRYARPVVGEGVAFNVTDGRHPVLEALNFDQPFVPNDTLLDPEDHQILLITGPNMAGKSTYIRQVALITLMAHMGGFVPASSAVVPLVDRIFTRVGAMDQLAKGQSTFLVEMSETANILNNATDESLVILDEIGRGTSTYDGLSIAWSVIEYLHNTPGRRPLTLFATHYHELVELEGPLARLKNYNVAVLEEAERVAFLYKIVRGSTDHSYGIYAAQVAGLPKAVVSRAKEILGSLEMGNAVEVVHPGDGGDSGAGSGGGMVQLTLFDVMGHPVVERLREVNVEKLTPLEALNLLAQLRRLVQ
ncbi:DNA mismatch repair protein MutS [candidate division BRC1 bacterium HGW-BRC1-1]|jgi:DNA mismatch repair protein MutS|nr:MAG: DNA mismatch repair protein MutS [candidate division BRC1 bacterium HGW-BRC1-1]